MTLFSIFFSLQLFLGTLSHELQEVFFIFCFMLMLKEVHVYWSVFPTKSFITASGSAPEQISDSYDSPLFDWSLPSPRTHNSASRSPPPRIVSQDVLDRSGENAPIREREGQTWLTSGEIIHLCSISPDIIVLTQLSRCRIWGQMNAHTKRKNARLKETDISIAHPFLGIVSVPYRSRHSREQILFLPASNTAEGR